MQSFLSKWYSSNQGTIQDHGKLADFAYEFGGYCQFDLFGIENSYYQIKPTIDFSSDAQRIAMIESLVANKFEDKVLVAHDIHTKHRLVFNHQFGQKLDYCPKYYFFRKNLEAMDTSIS